MSTTPECAVEVPENEEDPPKERLSSQECRINIGQGGADGGGDTDDEAEFCRICYEGASAGALVTLCRCKGSMGYTHVRCLERWLDTSQKTRCELCGFAYHVELTKRHAALPSLYIWARQHADTRLLVIDLLTVLFVTPVVGAYVYLSVRGILELSEGPAGVDPNETTSDGLTAIGLMVLCIAIVICYVIWLCVTFSAIFNEWYEWWSSCFRIRVVNPKEEERDRRPAVVREEQGLPREPSLELIFSRGVLSNRQRSTV